MPVTSVPTYDPYFDINTKYPDSDMEWLNDPGTAGYIYGEQHQEAPWTRRLSQMGFGANTKIGQFAQSQFGKFQEGHQAVNLNAPGYYWQKYLDENLTADKIQHLYNQQGAAQRGINESTWAPNARYLRRG